VAGDEVEALAEAYRVVRQAGRGEDDVIILGDFNEDDAHLGRLTQIPGVKAAHSRRVQQHAPEEAVRQHRHPPTLDDRVHRQLGRVRRNAKV